MAFKLSFKLVDDALYTLVAPLVKFYVCDVLIKKEKVQFPFSIEI